MHDVLLSHEWCFIHELFVDKSSTSTYKEEQRNMVKVRRSGKYLEKGADKHLRDRHLSSMFVKSKSDIFSKITNGIKLKNKQHHWKVLLDSFSMNGHKIREIPGKGRR